jgi:hypothetical protein
VELWTKQATIENWLWINPKIDEKSTKNRPWLCIRTNWIGGMLPIHFVCLCIPQAGGVAAAWRRRRPHQKSSAKSSTRSKTKEDKIMLISKGRQRSNSKVQEKENESIPIERDSFINNI